jgi:hypothetical protein
MSVGLCCGYERCHTLYGRMSVTHTDVYLWVFVVGTNDVTRYTDLCLCLIRTYVCGSLLWVRTVSHSIRTYVCASYGRMSVTLCCGHERCHTLYGRMSVPHTDVCLWLFVAGTSDVTRYTDLCLCLIRTYVCDSLLWVRTLSHDIRTYVCDSYGRMPVALCSGHEHCHSIRTYVCASYGRMSVALCCGHERCHTIYGRMSVPHTDVCLWLFVAGTNDVTRYTDLCL